MLKPIDIAMKMRNEIGIEKTEEVPKATNALGRPEIMYPLVHPKAIPLTKKPVANVTKSGGAFKKPIIAPLITPKIIDITKDKITANVTGKEKFFSKIAAVIPAKLAMDIIERSIPAFIIATICAIVSNPKTGN